MLPALADHHTRLQHHVQSLNYQSWRHSVEATGGCAQPVHLTGSSEIRHTPTGFVLSSRKGHVMVPCGNRRESVCPSCSDRYAADVFHLLRAGLAGGSHNVPEAVTTKPRMFVTLTAPSFGAVHNRRTSKNGKILPCTCGKWHHEADPALGQPINPDSYDYVGHVLWHAHAGALWHRFTITLRRELCRATGIRVRDFPKHARLSFAKVAEFQKRGLIHFHAVIRIDGPNGPTDSAPQWATTELLSNAVRQAHADVSLTSPEIDGKTWSLAFGEQLDIRPIHASDSAQLEDTSGVVTDEAIAGYIAKYATKGTGKTDTPDRRIRSQNDINHLRVHDHHRRIIQTAWNLGEREELADLNLRRWAHMLGFRGHFLSKSRRYSTTFRDMHTTRREYRLAQQFAELGIDDTHTISVVNDWHMTHIGHRTPEQRELALAIAERKRHQRKERSQQ